MSDRRRGWAALLLVVALGGGLRAWVMDATYPVDLVGDEVYYADVAVSIASGRGHVYEGSLRAWRPPAQAWLLSRFAPAEWLEAYADPDENRRQVAAWRVVRPLLALQVCLGTLLVALTALLARALFDPATGLAAGAAAAVYPTFVAYSHYLWSETLFAVLLTAGLAGAVHAARSPSAAAGAATGLAFGLGALTREIALGVAAVVALWWVRTAPPPLRRRALGAGAALLGVAVLVVLPWTWRNQVQLGRLVPVSTVGWFAAAHGNSLDDPAWWVEEGARYRSFASRYFSLSDELERLDYARNTALERIAAAQPTWLAKKLVRNLALLFSPDSYLFYKLERGAYGEVSPAAEAALRSATLAAWIAVAVAAVLGIAAAPGPGRRALPCLVLGLVAAVHVLTNATSRFRVPFVPLLLAYASWAALHPDAVRRRLAHGGWVAPGLVLLFFLGVCVPYYFVVGGRS